MDDDHFSNDDEDEVFVALLIDDEEDVVVQIEDDDSVVIDINAKTSNNSSVTAPDNESFISEPLLEDRVEVENDDSVVVKSFQDRQKAKFKAQTRTKRQWLTLTAVTISVLLVSIILALESPIYDVDHVKIDNTSNAPLTNIEVQRIRKFTQPLLGEPMYRVKVSDVEKDIKTLPTISEVMIEKKWPSTIIVSIDRRLAVAYVETDKGNVLIDNNGFAFQKVKDAPEGLPSFDGLEELVFTHKISDKNYVEILKAAPVEIKEQIAHVKSEKGGYVVELDDGIDIILGNGEQLEEKLAIAWSVLNAKKRSEIGYIDVSVPSLPVSGSPQLKV